MSPRAATFAAVTHYDDRVLHRSDSLDDCAFALRAEWPHLDAWARASSAVIRPAAIDLGSPDGLTESERDHVWSELLEDLKR